MSGSGTYKYGYWRLPPRCSGCEKPLEIPETCEKSSVVKCQCGSSYHCYPAPDWLKKLVPSANACVTPDPPPEANGKEPLKMNEASSKPIVMSCPKCAGSLSVSGESERIMECAYCQSDVYIPDEVWTRLHPVQKSKEWFVSLTGRNIHQLRAERRRKDEEEEKKFLAGWKIRNAPKKARRKLRSFLPVIFTVIALAAAVSLIGSLASGGKKGMDELWADVGPFLIVPVVVLVPLWLALRPMVS